MNAPPTTKPGCSIARGTCSKCYNSSMREALAGSHVTVTPPWKTCATSSGRGAGSIHAAQHVTRHGGPRAACADTCKLAFHALISSSQVQTNASSPFLRTTRCTSCCWALANFTAVRVTCSMPSSTIQMRPPDTQVSMINADTPMPRPSPLPAHVTPSFASRPPASSAKARALFSALSSIFGCKTSQKRGTENKHATIHTRHHLITAPTCTWRNAGT